MASSNASFYSNAASDAQRTTKSKVIHFSLAAGGYDAFRIQRFTLVKDIWLFVATAFTAATLTIGFKGNGETEDEDAFMDATQTALATAGIKRATSDAQPFSEGKYFNKAGGAITLTLTNTASTAGEAYIFVDTVIIH